MKKIFSIITIAALFTACSSKQDADLIVSNAKVYTVDSTFSVAEAFAVKDGKILAVGTNADILSQYNSKEMLNAKEAAIYPGFIDAHAHFVGYGEGLFTAD
jgi:predicted amidohydrolase YtcJ